MAQAPSIAALFWFLLFWVVKSRTGEPPQVPVGFLYLVR